MRVLAVIPARAGSKGIPGKNTADLAGKPLIQWTLDAASQAESLAHVIVSTDCSACKALATLSGVQVVDRPADLATDEATSYAVVEHAVAAAGGDYDAVMLLQPTNPLRTPEDIDKAVALLWASPATVDGVLSVTPIDDYHPARMYTSGAFGLLRLQWFLDVRRQELPALYLRDGSIYLVRTSALEHGLMGRKTAPLVIPRERSVRIDSPADLRYAEFLLSQ